MASCGVSRGFGPAAILAASLFLLALPSAAAAQHAVVGADLGAHVACHGTQQSHPCIFLRTGAHAGLDAGAVGFSASFAHVAARNYGLTYDLFNYWGALEVRVARSLWTVLGTGTRRVRLWDGNDREWKNGFLGILGVSFRDALAGGGPVQFRADLFLEASHYEDGVNLAPANTLRIEPALTVGLDYRFSLR